MKKEVEIWSRLDFPYTAKMIDDNTIHFDANKSSYFRCGEDKNKLSFIDCEGGPFIALWELASDIHNSFPKREIVKITLKKNNIIVLKLEKKKRKGTKL
jgi:hypothetical protein